MIFGSLEQTWVDYTEKISIKLLLLKQFHSYNCNYMLKQPITVTTEGCIDDERQFKTAKRSQGTPQALGDATVLKRFSAITSLFFVIDRKESIFGINEFFCCVLYGNFQIFNFRDGHVTTFRHPSGISAKCLVTDSPDYIGYSKENLKIHKGVPFPPFLSSLTPPPLLPLLPCLSLPLPFPSFLYPLPLEVGSLKSSWRSGGSSAVSSPSGVWSGAPAEIDFGAF